MQMVANRFLPYPGLLAEHFQTVYTTAQTSQFSVYQAALLLKKPLACANLAFLPVAHAIAYSTQWHTALFPYTIFKHYKCTARYALGDHL